MNTLRENSTSSVGFLVGMGAWSVTFITLIGGYVIFRMRVGQWLDVYMTDQVLMRAILNTAFLVGSSVALHVFLKRRQESMYALGAMLGALFLVGQWKLWKALMLSGLTLKASIAGSFLYLLTGFHAIHILIGLLIIIPMGFMLKRIVGSEKDRNRFSFALKFWDLLLWFWLVLLVLIFIIK